MTEIVLVLALAALALAVWKPATRMVFGALDERAERIRHELDEAARLREEAQALLAKYQRQLHDGEAQAERIAQRARDETERQEGVRRAQLQAALQRRTDQAMERIALEEAKAVQAVRARAAELSIEATRHLLREHLDATRAGSLVDEAIGEVGRRLAS